MQEIILPERRLWVVSKNDLEAVEIIRLLDTRGERVLISFQKWGASWSGLERPILDELQRAIRSGGFQIIGVELGGKPDFEARAIDHHKYKNDNRWNPLSSLEQVAGELGTELTKFQRQVAVNDRSYIPGLRREIWRISTQTIAAIRRADRRAQGLTKEDEDRAKRDVAGAIVEGKRCWLTLTSPPNSAHGDFLLEDGSILELMIASPRQWQYSGPGAAALGSMPWTEQHWSGGDPENGYFCIQDPSDETGRVLRNLFDAGRLSLA